MGDKLPQMMMNNKLLRSVGLGALVCALTLSAGCGQKGPLSLPKEQAKPAATAAAAASATSTPSIKP